MEGSSQIDPRIETERLTYYMMTGGFFTCIVGFLPGDTRLSWLWYLLMPAIIHLIVGYSYSRFCYTEKRMKMSGMSAIYNQRRDTKFWFMLVSVQTSNTMIRFMLDQKTKLLSEMSAKEIWVTIILIGSVCLVLIIPCFFDIGIDSRMRYVESTLPAVLVGILGIAGFRQMYDACLMFEFIDFVITIYLLITIFRLYPFDQESL